MYDLLFVLHCSFLPLVDHEVGRHGSAGVNTIQSILSIPVNRVQSSEMTHLLQSRQVRQQIFDSKYLVGFQGVHVLVWLSG